MLKPFSIKGQKFLDVFEAVELGLAGPVPLIVFGTRVEAYERDQDPKEERPTRYEQLRAGYVALGVLTLMWRDPVLGRRLFALVEEFVKEHTC